MLLSQNDDGALFIVMTNVIFKSSLELIIDRFKSKQMFTLNKFEWIKVYQEQWNKNHKFVSTETH